MLMFMKMYVVFFNFSANVLKNLSKIYQLCIFHLIVLLWFLEMRVCITVCMIFHNGRLSISV